MKTPDRRESGAAHVGYADARRSYRYFFLRPRPCRCRRFHLQNGSQRGSCCGGSSDSDARSIVFPVSSLYVRRLPVTCPIAVTNRSPSFMSRPLLYLKASSSM